MSGAVKVDGRILCGRDALVVSIVWGSFVTGYVLLLNEIVPPLGWGGLDMLISLASFRHM